VRLGPYPFQYSTISWAFAWACGHTRVDALGGPQYLNQDASWLVTGLIFNFVCVEGCSGSRARLADDQHRGEEKESSVLEIISEDEETKEMLGDEVKARYPVRQKTAVAHCYGFRYSYVPVYIYPTDHVADPTSMQTSLSFLLWASNSREVVPYPCGCLQFWATSALLSTGLPSRSFRQHADMATREQ